MEAAGEAYMAELRRRFPERVEAERRMYAKFAAGRTKVHAAMKTVTTMATAPATDPMIGGMTRREWKELEEESV